MVFFFFQAEDGIRDLTVTGVQTCALPIYREARLPDLPGPRRRARPARRGLEAGRAGAEARHALGRSGEDGHGLLPLLRSPSNSPLRRPVQTAVANTGRQGGFKAASSKGTSWARSVS